MNTSKERIQNLLEQRSKQSAANQASEVDIDARVQAAVEQQFMAREKVSAKIRARHERRKLIKQSHQAWLDDIVKAAEGSALVQAGLVKESAQAEAVRKVFPEWTNRLEEAGQQVPSTFDEVLNYAREKVSEDVAADLDSKAELEEALVEAASMDPDMAAKLISMETGQDVSGDEVDELTSSVAQASLLEDMEAGKEEEEEPMAEDTKEEIEKTSSFVHNLPPLSGAIVRAQAFIKKSHIINHYRRQAQGSK